MNLIDDELTEALRGERQAVADRMHASSLAAEPTPRQLPWAQQWIRLAVPAVFVAFVAVGAVSLMNNGSDRNELATTSSAAPSEPAPSIEPELNDQPGSVDEPGPPPPSDIPPETSSPTPFDPTKLTIAVSPHYQPSNLARPELDQLTGKSMLSSNSAELYVVASNGLVELPTGRRNDVFSFTGSMPGTPDCRWVSEMVPADQQVGEGSLARITMTPLCGFGTVDSTAPLRDVEIRLVDTEDFSVDGRNLTAMSIRQTSGYALADDIPTLPPLRGNIASVHAHEFTSMLVIETNVQSEAGCQFVGTGLIPAPSAAGDSAAEPIEVGFACL